MKKQLKITSACVFFLLTIFTFYKCSKFSSQEVVFEENNRNLYEHFTTITDHLAEMGFQHYEQTFSKKNFHKTSLESNQNNNTDTMLYKNEAMGQYLYDKLMQDQLEIDVFDTSKSVYRKVNDHLLDFVNKTANITYEKYDDFCVAQIALGVSNIEKNTIAIYLAQYKSVVKLYDNKEDKIAYLKLLKENSFRTKSSQGLDNAPIRFFQIKKHTVVGRAWGWADCIASKTKNGAFIGAGTCATYSWFTGPISVKATVACGVVGGMMGAIYGVANC